LPIEEATEAAVRKSAAAGLAGAGIGILAALAATAIARRRAQRQQTQQRGLGQVRQAVTAARGDDAAPQQAVGFGQE
jgi:hypothetical protein